LRPPEPPAGIGQRGLAPSSAGCPAGQKRPGKWIRIPGGKAWSSSFETKKPAPAGPRRSKKDPRKRPKPQAPVPGGADNRESPGISGPEGTQDAAGRKDQVVVERQAR
jgi:hypothetical protein